MLSLSSAVFSIDDNGRFDLFEIATEEKLAAIRLSTDDSILFV